MAAIRVRFGYLLALLLLASQSNAVETNDSQHVVGGPVSDIMENLAYNTATVTDEMQLQFGERVERLIATLLGSVEVIVATALDQLSAPLMEAERQLANGQCQPPGWEGMDELLQRVNRQLSNCTHDLGEIVDTFRKDAANVAAAIGQAVKEIVALPALCRSTPDAGGGGGGGAFDDVPATVGMTFASSASCFVQKIADINQELSVELNRAALLLTHTRQLSRTAVTDAEQCTAVVISEVGEYLKEALKNC